MSKSINNSIDQLADEVDELDLFGEVSEEEQQALDTQKQQRVAEASAKKKADKPKPAAKTIITIDIVPGVPDVEDEDWDSDEEYDEDEDEEDELSPEETMSNLITYVRGIQLDGLTWSVGHQVLPVYGTLSKLRINATIVDDLVPSTEDVTDLIVSSANGTVRSAEVISFQKV